MTLNAQGHETGNAQRHIHNGSVYYIENRVRQHLLIMEALIKALKP